MLVVGMLPAMALNKLAKELDKVYYGMHYNNLIELLGTPSGRSTLQTGEMRLVFVLGAGESTVSCAPYYIILRDSAVIEKGETNYNNKKEWPIPFNGVVTSSDTVEQKTTSKDGLVTIQIPRYYALKDRIFICNKSLYPVLRAVVVNGDDHSKVIGLCSFLQVNDCAEIADYPGNGLCALQGATIAIKAKGTTNTNVISQQNIQGDNDQSDYITYDFDVSVAEHNHDLYIYLYTNNAGIEDTSTGADPLDF